MEGKVDCNACKGIEKITPIKYENPSGQSSLSYRVGKYSQFKESMHTAMSLDQNLRDLTNRQDSDLALGLVDSWSIIADVITFYQERIANEGFLRTATEKKSILELARMIGYEINPGVAASTFLAFTMEDSKNRLQTIIDVGTKVQSIPSQDQRPQTFETVEKIQANPEWNAVRPLLTKMQIVSDNSSSFIFKGTDTRLKIGDLIAACKRIVSKKVFKITMMIVTKVLVQSSRQQTLVEVCHVSEVEKSFLSLQEGVFAFRIKSGLFGHNAPELDPINSKTAREKKIKSGNGVTEWDMTTIDGFSNNLKNKGGYVYLDNMYSSILPHDLVVLRSGETYDVFQVQAVDELSLAKFAISTKVTELNLDLKSSNSKNFQLRNVTVYGQPEYLELSHVDILDDVQSNTIALNNPVPSLKKGKRVIVTGNLSGNSLETFSEIGIIHEHSSDGKTITLEKNLVNSYKRDSVLFNFNVARATHGETRQETLGSGDVSKLMQTFVLKQKPLTYVSSSKGTGSESTLEVRVDDILWHQASNLLDLGPKDRYYITRLDENGDTSIIFGDGNRGARPNTGNENIKAKYRSGIGMDGIVGANQITLLMNRPLGVRGVSNLLPTEGAQDPEDPDIGRRNAPLKILTMGRVVSLQDFEDYANAFAGIGKAKATWGWNGHRKIVCLTVMSTSGQAISQESDLYKNLVDAIKDIKDPLINFTVCGFNNVTFDLTAKILVDPDKEFDKVKIGVENILLDEFSASKRQFGQGITLSQVMSVIQNSDGVLAVDVDFLFKTGSTRQLQNTLPSQTVRWGFDLISLAELLVINSGGIQILEMKN